MTPSEAFIPSDSRATARFEQKTRAVASRIQDRMGDLTQSDLADKVGKSPSTVSNHLSGRANLTLRTILEYEMALEESVLSVPDVKRPKKKRRRRGKRRKRRVSKQREALGDIDPVEQKLHTFLTTLTARIGQIIQENEALSQRELARRMDRDESYVSRALSGGVNFTLKTIAAIEEALEARVLRVEGASDPVDGSYRSGTLFARVKGSSDGGYCEDTSGVVIGVMAQYVSGELDTKSPGASDPSVDAEEELVAA